ncbi:MAG TPA: FG-GAP-like repeat-containing protein [Pyrinomonadaceae bacterium]|nr:FG-GAP-like repeat-containing protein [Pyrinomonadaceae bacterium]
MRNTCVLGLLVLCAFGLFGETVIAQDPRLKADLERSFESFEVVRPTSIWSDGTLESIRVHADGRRHDIRIWPNDMFAQGYFAESTTSLGKISIPRPIVNTYQGVIEGIERSEVRLTVTGMMVEGFFEIGSDRFFIEPAARFSDHAAAGEYVVYREEDAVEGNNFYCASEMLHRLKMGQSFLDLEQQDSSISASRNLEIATDADLQYVNIFGGAAQANSNIVSILNMVEGTFASELDIEITITYQHAWSSADPFAGATSSDVLMNFMSHWNANFPRNSYPRDTGHLFSGKSYVQSAGIAFMGSVCYFPDFAYGVSGYVSWAPGKYLIPAHELGHNLGADHAEVAQGCGNTLMNAFLSTGTPLSFCQFSRNQIGTFVSQYGSCLLNGAGGGPTPTPTPSPIPTPTPTPVPTPTPTPTPTPAPTPTPTPIPTPTPTPVPTPTPAPTPTPQVRTRFDFDADGRADLVVFRPSNGTWYMNRTASGFYTQVFGQNGDVPVAADYDGDGKADPAVFRNGTWYRISTAAMTYDVVQFGVSGDIPRPADFNGDGRADIAVFRPSTGQWFWVPSGTGGLHVANFGQNGDRPMPGDYDGDGRADLAVFRPSNGTWYRLDSSGFFTVTQFGVNGDIPVSADFDGDGRLDHAVWRPSNGNWYILGSNSFSVVNFGVSGDIPTPADFDGDRITDIAVFRPSNGTWYRIASRNKNFEVIQYGQPGDIPAPAL